MDALLTLPSERRRRLCEEAEDRLGLSARNLEKDFWVCLTLRELFSLPDCGEHLTFKGGTSLSKGWQLIGRFSEDIDIVVDRSHLGFPGDALNPNRLKRLRAACRGWIADPLLPSLRARLLDLLGTAQDWQLDLAPLDQDRDQGTLLFSYPTAFPAPGPYVKPVVRIELGARSDTEPSESPAIRPYLAEVLPEALPEFVVRTVAPRRTFWEKAMLLHEESFRPADRPRPARLARHYYDLWCLIVRGVADQALADPRLFERVASHREAFWSQSWVDYSTLRPGSLRILPAPGQVSAWRQDYAAMREMFFSEPPRFDEVLARVGELETRVNETAGGSTVS